MALVAPRPLSSYSRPLSFCSPLSTFGRNGFGHSMPLLLHLPSTLFCFHLLPLPSCIGLLLHPPLYCEPLFLWLHPFALGWLWSLLALSFLSISCHPSRFQTWKREGTTLRRLYPTPRERNTLAKYFSPFAFLIWLFLMLRSISFMLPSLFWLITHLFSTTYLDHSRTHNKLIVTSIPRHFCMLCGHTRNILTFSPLYCRFVFGVRVTNSAHSCGIWACSALKLAPRWIWLGFLRSRSLCCPPCMPALCTPISCLSSQTIICPDRTFRSATRFNFWAIPQKGDDVRVMANAVPHTLFQWSLSCLQFIILFLSLMGTLLSYYTLVFHFILLEPLHWYYTVLT